MRYFKLDNKLVSRYDADGTAELGYMVVGEDDIVRWLSRTELDTMEAQGEFNPGQGFNVHARSA
jgi:hypothetical protein